MNGGIVILWRTLLLSVLTAQIAHAYVAGVSSAPAGSVEFGIKSEWMRGLAGPENLPETEQKQKPSVNIYEFSAGYNIGSIEMFQDIKLRASAAYYTSEAELLPGSQIYPRDEGGFAGVELSTNFVHDPEHLLGVFLRSQHPLQMDVDKFINPKIDRIGLGLQTAFKFNDSFGQESVIFVGSGLHESDIKQNPSLSASLLGVWILSGEIFKNGAAIRLGPFFDADIAQRNDNRYGTRGLRAFRLGLTLSASYSLYRNLAFEVGYIQKFTGAYFRATKDFFVAARTFF